MDKVRRVVTFNRVLSEQTDADRAAYEEQAKIISHFGKYVRERAAAVGSVGVGALSSTVVDSEDEELEVPAASAAAVETGFEWESYDDGMGFEDRGVMDL